MGDELEDCGWQGDAEIDFAASYNSEDEAVEFEEVGADGEDGPDDPSSKKAKKKRKLLQLKEKSSKSSRKLRLYETPESQYEAVTQYLLDSCNLSDLNASHFFNPYDVPKKNNSGMVEKGGICSRALKVGCQGFKKEVKSRRGDPGCPLAVIICASANRCVTINSEISHTFQCKVSKLFAKHLKVQDQVEALKTFAPVAIGTPHRINKLIEFGALNLTQSTVILMDITKDAREMNMFSSQDTHPQIYSFLSEHVQPELAHLNLALIDSNNPSNPGNSLCCCA